MLTPIEKIDIFLRFATVGQLLLMLTLLLVWRPLTTRSVLAILITPCAIAYLFLTAPAPYADFGPRGLTMSLVHCLPFFAWFLIADIFDARPGVFAARRALASAVTAILVVNVFVFWVADAPEVPHQISHWVSVALLAHIIFLTLYGKSDDLLPARRRMRAWIIVICTAHFLTVIAVEIVDPGFGDPKTTNAINASIIFLMATVLGVYWAGHSSPILLASGSDAANGRPNLAETSKHNAIDGRDAALYERLMAFMEAGGYKTTGLGIRQLSDKLAAPEHQLRRLINQGLGYRNFSTFLNTYRIDAASRRLRDQADAHIPVLTIALELGFGSIGPFNRAFKAITGKTPTAYRRIHNRP